MRDDRSTAGFRRGLVLPAVVILLYAALMLRERMPVETPPPWPRWSFVDFRDTVWVPVRDLLSGHDPYDVVSYRSRHPYVQEFPLYAPAVLVLGLPLSLLPWPMAVLCWAAVLLAAFVILVRRSVRAAGLHPTSAVTPLALALLLISPPGNQPASAGQFAIPAAAAVVVAVTDRRVALIAVAGAVALIKPQVGLPLVLLLLVTGRVRGALAAVGLAALVSIPIVGILVARTGGIEPWTDTLRRNLELTASSPNTGADRAGSTRVDVVGTMERLGLHPPALLAVGVTLALVIGTAALAHRCHRAMDGTSGAATAWWASVAAAMVLWTPSELYALLVAVPAVTVALRAVIGAPRDRQTWFDALPGLLLAIPFVHATRVDVLIGLGNGLAWLNCAAVVAAMLSALLWLRRTPDRPLDGTARPVIRQ